MGELSTVRPPLPRTTIGHRPTVGVYGGRGFHEPGTPVQVVFLEDSSQLFGHLAGALKLGPTGVAFLMSEVTL